MGNGSGENELCGKKELGNDQVFTGRMFGNVEKESRNYWISAIEFIYKWGKRFLKRLISVRNWIFEKIINRNRT